MPDPRIDNPITADYSEFDYVPEAEQRELECIEDERTEEDERLADAKRCGDFNQENMMGEEKATPDETAIASIENVLSMLETQVKFNEFTDERFGDLMKCVELQLAVNDGLSKRIAALEERKTEDE